MADTGNTTSPADPAERLRSSERGDRLVPAFVICHCVPEPGRAGEVALFDPKARGPFVIGRAGVHFFRQRPGEMVDCGRLKGETISGEQLVISNEGEGVRVHNVGRAPVFVDGARLPQGTSVHALPGTVVEAYGHSVFLLTLRPLSMPEPHRLLLPLHRFGELDSMAIAGEAPAIWKLRRAIALAATSTGHVLLYGARHIASSSTLQAKTTVPNLPVGTSCAFRFRPVTKTGEGDWSQVVTLLVK